MGIAFVFISHDMAVIERMSHRVAVMYAGEIVEMGPTATVLHAPQHPYTRRLLAAVPTPDPLRRRARAAVEAMDLPSLIRPSGYVRPASQLTELAPGHFVRIAA
jgi:peptide/nickel transport system ATP-binding protein